MVGWLNGWMVGWLDGWLVGWLDGCPPNQPWLDGWLVGVRKGQNPGKGMMSPYPGTSMRSHGRDDGQTSVFGLATAPRREAREGVPWKGHL